MGSLLPVGDLSDTTAARDDLWGWVNDAWLASDPIPGDRARYGLSDAKRAHITEELTEIVRDPDAPQAVAALHRLWTDAAARDAAGVDPVRHELDAAGEIADAGDVLAVWGRLQRDGVTGPFSVHVLPREDDPARWQISLFQSGTTLPPPLHARHRDDLTAHARALHAAAGLDVRNADVALQVEDALTAVAWVDPEGDSDEALHHPHPWAHLTSRAGIEQIGVDLTGYAESLAAPEPARRADFVWNLCQPSYAAGLGRLVHELPLDAWRAFLCWRVLVDRAPSLTATLDDLATCFGDCTLAGQPEPTPIWRRAVAGVQRHLPMDLAHAWVAAHVDPARRDATRRLAEQLRDQMRRTLLDCSWLGEESTRAAITKLDAVVLNIGWPDRWDTLDQLDADSLPAALRGCARHHHDQQLAQVTAAVDRGVWGPPPFTVNTFYHPFYNQLLVEAASLPPLDVLDDPAVLLGQYGSIIGHELGHAFDTRGSTRGPDGRLREWWTGTERAAFTDRADAVQAQVDGTRPRALGTDVADTPEARVDGRRVGFECVAELIGLQLAWDTYLATTTPDQRAARTDGLTGPERFFAAKAYGRRATDRPRTALARLASDVHPPFDVFANLARNLDGYHETFATRPGDGMWLDPEDRIRLF